MILRKREKTKKSTDNTAESSDQKKQKNKKDRDLMRDPYHIIKYNHMLENGICCLEDDVYSKSIMFKDINYQLAQDDVQEKILYQYKSLLNSMGNDVDVSLVINNRVVDRDEFEEAVLMEHKGDGMDPIRVEMNQHLMENMSHGNSFIVQDKMFTFSCHEENYLEAKKTLWNMEKGFQEQLENMGCTTNTMEGIDRMKVLRSITKPASPLQSSYKDLDVGTSTKDWIVPNAFNFHKDYFEMDDRYCSVLFLLNYPTYMQDKLICELSRIEANITISLHMSIMSKDESIALINKKSQLVDIQVDDENEKRRKRGDFSETLPPNLRAHVESIQEWRTAVEKADERIFETKLLVMINAKNKDEMDQLQKDVVRIGKRCSCDMSVMEYEQEIGFNAVLPLGLPWNGSYRLLLTDNVGNIMPFTSQELFGTQNPIFYGINQTTGNMILCNRKNLVNANGFILGKTGAGKSFSTKKELSWIFLNDDQNDIIIIDPQGEYKPMVDTFNKYATSKQADVLEISSTSKLYFNPFDGDITQDDFTKQKAEFIQVLMAEMVGKGSLSPQAQSITDQIVYKVYQDYEQALREKDFEKAVMPTLETFYNELGKLDDPVAQAMHSALWIYVYGTYNLFAHPSNVNVDSRLLVYDISRVGESIRTLGSKVILESIRDRILQNHKKGRRTWVYIDEIWRLLKDPYSENYLYEFWKWVRKYGAACTGLTQNISDLLRSQKGSTMLENSEFYIILGQNNYDAMQLKSLLKLSEKQTRFLMHERKGAGLIRAGNTIVPFADKFAKDTICYEMWQTDPASTKEDKDELLEMQEEAKRFQEEHQNSESPFEQTEVEQSPTPVNENRTQNQEVQPVQQSQQQPTQYFDYGANNVQPVNQPYVEQRVEENPYSQPQPYVQQQYTQTQMPQQQFYAGVQPQYQQQYQQPRGIVQQQDIRTAQQPVQQPQYQEAQPVQQPVEQPQYMNNNGFNANDY